MIDRVLSLLRLSARHGRWLLIAGLICGFALPPLAQFLRGLLPELVTLLLFLAALRLGPRSAVGAARDLGQSLGYVVLFQLLAPTAFAVLLIVTGWTGPLALALALMLAASPIAGSPSLTLLMGHDGAPALRLLIAGTALLPLTVIPTFLLLPDLVLGEGVFRAAARLLVVIAIATGLAFIIRATVLRNPSPKTHQAIDGASAICLAVAVVGLMAAVGPAIYSNPTGLVFHLLVAFAANFGLQICAYLALKNTSFQRQSVGFSVSAGNRNMALFLAALPAAVVDPMLLFIGCYQVPMYLTPVLLHRFYADKQADGFTQGGH
ncbi:MAG: hypothetical protein NXI27_13025 [Alphaproteobacteria bacterium]|nr:hypothetical protein [Alphaproteobacteria bacterium]